MIKKLSIITTLAVLASSPTFASITISAVPHNANCLAVVYCKITGHHDIKIVNESNTAKTYNINAGLNSGDGTVDVYEKKNIRLEPGETYDDHHEYSLYEKYNISAGYHNSVYAGVYGDEALTKNAYGNVVVYPANKK